MIALESEIIHLTNVFLSSHVESTRGDRYRSFFALMVAELVRFFGGHETHFDLTVQAQASREGREMG